MKDRKNPFCVISIEADKNGMHYIQTNSGWTENPYSDYVVVPDEMVQDILKTKGYCEFETADEDVIGFEWVKNEETGKPEKVEKVIGTRKVVSKWVAGVIPEVEPLPESEPTMEDDIDALLVDHEYRLTLLELGVNE